VFYWRDRGFDLAPTYGYHPQQQDWTPAKAGFRVDASGAREPLAEGRFWMGRPKGEPITPESLLRKNHHGGAVVELADGGEWLIPVADKLPRNWGLNDYGVPARFVPERFEWYCRKTAEFAFLIRNHKLGADIEFPEAWTFAVAALSMNYRLSAEIIDWLGLLNDHVIVLLIGGAIAWKDETDYVTAPSDSPAIPGERSVVLRRVPADV
jgi:hypothetical protein